MIFSLQEAVFSGEKGNFTRCFLAGRAGLTGWAGVAGRAGVTGLAGWTGWGRDRSHDIVDRAGSMDGLEWIDLEELLNFNL